MSANPLRLFTPWYGLYLAAINEADRTRLAGRISEAESALIRRERELFAKPRADSEHHAINNALNALRALRNCHRLK
jgi:hypothetical protein